MIHTIKMTSLVRPFVPLQASPVGLLGRFAPSQSGFVLSHLLLARFAISRFVLCTCIFSSFTSSGSRSHLACILFSSLARILCFVLFWEKSVSQSTQNVPKRIEMQNIFVPLWPIINLSGEVHSYLPQGPKECPCRFMSIGPKLWSL